jgi:hypothetical protein
MSSQGTNGPLPQPDLSKFHCSGRSESSQQHPDTEGSSVIESLSVFFKGLFEPIQRGFNGGTPPGNTSVIQSPTGSGNLSIHTPRKKSNSESDKNKGSKSPEPRRSSLDSDDTLSTGTDISRGSGSTTPDSFTSIGSPFSSRSGSRDISPSSSKSGSCTPSPSSSPGDGGGLSFMEAKVKAVRLPHEVEAAKQRAAVVLSDSNLPPDTDSNALLTEMVNGLRNLKSAENPNSPQEIDKAYNYFLADLPTTDLHTHDEGVHPPEELQGFAIANNIYFDKKLNCFCRKEYSKKDTEKKFPRKHAKDLDFSIFKELTCVFHEKKLSLKFSSEGVVDPDILVTQFNKMFEARGKICDNTSDADRFTSVIRTSVKQKNIYTELFTGKYDLPKVPKKLEKFVEERPSMTAVDIAEVENFLKTTTLNDMLITKININGEVFFDNAELLEFKERFFNVFKLLNEEESEIVRLFDKVLTMKFLDAQVEIFRKIFCCTEKAMIEKITKKSKLKSNDPLHPLPEEKSPFKSQFPNSLSLIWEIMRHYGDSGFLLSAFTAAALYEDTVKHKHDSSHSKFFVGATVDGPQDTENAVENFYKQIAIMEYIVSKYNLPVTYHGLEVEAEKVTIHDELEQILKVCRRIGHATQVMKSPSLPKLLKQMRKNKTCVEISYTTAKVTTKTEYDQLPTELHNHGIPIVITSDDIGAFPGESIKTQWRFLIENTDFEWTDIQTIIRNSIEFSFLDGDSIFDVDYVTTRKTGKSQKTTLRYRLKEKFAGIYDAEWKCTERLSQKQIKQLQLEKALMEFEKELVGNLESAATLGIFEIRDEYPKQSLEAA